MGGCPTPPAPPAASHATACTPNSYQLDRGPCPNSASLSALPSARLAQVATPLLAPSKAPHAIPDGPRHERRGEGNPGHDVHDDKSLDAHATERDESECASRQQ